MTFADRLRSIRLERGYTQEQLAGKVGVSRVSIGFYEHDRVPPINVIVKLAEALAVPVQFLIGGPQEDPNIDRYDNAFEVLETAGYSCEPSPWNGRYIISKDDLRVEVHEGEIVEMVESILIAAEDKKTRYIEKRLAAELVCFDEPGPHPDEDPTFEKY